jgi:hypothetical protein
MNNEERRMNPDIAAAVILLDSAGFDVKPRNKRSYSTLSSVQPGEEFVLRRNGHRCLMLDLRNQYGARLCWDYNDGRTRSYTGSSEVVNRSEE